MDDTVDGSPLRNEARDGVLPVPVPRLAGRGALPLPRGPPVALAATRRHHLPPILPPDRLPQVRSVSSAGDHPPAPQAPSLHP